MKFKKHRIATLAAGAALCVAALGAGNASAEPAEMKTCTLHNGQTVEVAEQAKLGGPPGTRTLCFVIFP